MKAIVYRSHGSPDVLRYEDIEKPTPDDNEVLIRVYAAAVNPLDWHLMRGVPLVVRKLLRLREPPIMQPGRDVAGQVEAAGRNVTQFKPGDAVFGSCRGAFAEYACTSESALVLKPDTVTFEQAASAPVAAFTALQGLRDKGRIRPGQKVLINGAAGGVGTFAVQIAKAFGAEVTGVCSTRNLEMVRSIGADHAIDYSREDFTTRGQRYDLIFDLVANHSLLACRRVMNRGGIYIGAGVGPGRPSMPGLLAGWIAALALSWFASRKFVMFMARSSKEDLIVVRDLMAAGKLTPVIDRCYRLSEVAEAIRYAEAGHARGKVVVEVSPTEGESMYGSIRRYRIRSGSVNEIVEKVKEGLVPILEKMRGFEGYYIVNAEANRATSFTVGADREAVEGMNRVALDWVQQNLPDRLSEPEVIAGPLPVALIHPHT